MLTALACLLGAVGWLLWLAARRDLSEAREEATEAHVRVRLAEGAESAIRAGEAAARDAQHAAESQVRVANAELGSLRMALSLLDADRKALVAQVDALGSDPGGKMYDSTSDRLRLYRVSGDVRNREDG